MWIVEDARKGVRIVCVNKHLLSKRLLGFLADTFWRSRVRLFIGFVPTFHDVTYFYDHRRFQQDVNPYLDEVSVHENYTCSMRTRWFS